MTRAFDEALATRSASARTWRFWRDLPAAGQIGIFLSAWYSQPLLDRVHGRTGMRELDERLDEILSLRADAASTTAR